MNTTASTTRPIIRLHRPTLAVAGAVIVLALAISAVIARSGDGPTTVPASTPRVATVVGTADALERSAATPGAPTQTLTADALERRGSAGAGSQADGRTYGSPDAAERWTGR